MADLNRSRKWLIVLILSLAAIAACAWFFAGEDTKTPTSAPTSQDKYRDVAIFGKELGTPVNSGFVFIDGKYIEPPYTVSQIGADIYINDILAVSASWPQPKYDVTKEPEGIPPGLTVDMTDDEMMEILGEHDKQECRYLSANPLPGKTFAQRYAEYFQKLPFVVSAESPEENRVSISMEAFGCDMAVGPYSLGDPEYNSTAELEAANLHRWRGSIERALANDNALFLYDAQRCDEYDMNAKVAAEKAALFVDIVNSQRTYKEKQGLLARMGIFSASKFLFGSRRRTEDMEDRILKVRFQANGSFSQRLNDLTKKLNITPMSYNNIPSVEALIASHAKMYKVTIDVESITCNLKAKYWAKRRAELQSTTQPAQSSRPTSSTLPGSKQK